MKHSVKRIAIILIAIILIFSCNKPDTFNNDPLNESNAVTVKGKPAPQPPYQLAPTPTQLQVYGVLHAGNDYCTWGTTRDMTEFDLKNSWIINRGDGKPSVNLVVLSFVNPLKLLNKTNDATTVNGIPRGMSAVHCGKLF